MMDRRTQPESIAKGDAADIILFDGVCHLCSDFVDFVIRRDRHGRFRFAALQSEVGAELLRERSIVVELGESGTMVLIRGDEAYLRSAAALRVFARLGFPWLILSSGLLIPRALRDPLYRWIARNRYRWFGRREVCRIPTPAERERFL